MTQHRENTAVEAILEIINEYGMDGFKDRQAASRFGNLSLKIPQIRGGVRLYPSALDKGLRSERALKAAMAEMHVQGVSTRKVSTIREKMCGLGVSSTQVSQAAKQLDKELEKWRTRPIEAIRPEKAVRIRLK